MYWDSQDVFLAWGSALKTKDTEGGLEGDGETASSVSCPPPTPST